MAKTDSTIQAAIDEAAAAVDNAGTDTPQESEAGAEVETDGTDDSSGELAQVKDQLLRMAADFDNFRKRTRRELEEARKFGVENLLNELLPVLDNQDRALQHTEDDAHPVVQGVKMIAKQFQDVLERFGVKGFDSIGQAFDPERHEAMGQEASAEHAPGTIISEMQRGYLLHDRLLRPARVMVASAPEEADTKPSPALDEPTEPTEPTEH